MSLNTDPIGTISLLIWGYSITFNTLGFFTALTLSYLLPSLVRRSAVDKRLIMLGLLGSLMLQGGTNIGDGKCSVLIFLIMSMSPLKSYVYALLSCYLSLSLLPFFSASFIISNSSSYLSFSSSFNFASFSFFLRKFTTIRSSSDCLEDISGLGNMFSPFSFWKLQMNNYN